MGKHKKHILTKQEVSTITDNEIRACKLLIAELESLGNEGRKASLLKKKIGRFICKLRWRYGITISWLQVNSSKEASNWLHEREITDVERGFCNDVNTYTRTLLALEELIGNSATPDTLGKKQMKHRIVERPRGTSPVIYKPSRTSGEHTRKEWRNVIVRRG